ncbi:phage protein [Pseudomonas phage PA02]|nr:phage protein [Pseudomonas phage PA02]
MKQKHEMDCTSEEVQRLVYVLPIEVVFPQLITLIKKFTYLTNKDEATAIVLLTQWVVKMMSKLQQDNTVIPFVDISIQLGNGPDWDEFINLFYTTGIQLLHRTPKNLIDYKFISVIDNKVVLLTIVTGKEWSQYAIVANFETAFFYGRARCR